MDICNAYKVYLIFTKIGSDHLQSSKWISDVQNYKCASD